MLVHPGIDVDVPALPMQIRKDFGAELKSKDDSDIVAESLVLECLLQRLNSKSVTGIA